MKLLRESLELKRPASARLNGVGLKPSIVPGTYLSGSMPPPLYTGRPESVRRRSLGLCGLLAS
jgi:hypothetical protein